MITATNPIGARQANANCCAAANASALLQNFGPASSSIKATATVVPIVPAAVPKELSMAANMP